MTIGPPKVRAAANELRCSDTTPVVTRGVAVAIGEMIPLSPDGAP